MNRQNTISINDLNNKMQRASACGHPELWDQWANAYGNKPAQLEFPLGELSNPGIAGFVWVWKMKGTIQTASIESDDQFNAQGLEGKIVIQTTLTTALLAYRELPEHRRAIRFDR
jgi:hypothetical protein